MSCLKVLVEQPAITSQNAITSSRWHCRRSLTGPSWTSQNGWIPSWPISNDLPNPDAHAVAHVIVGNQIAFADETRDASVSP